MICENIKCNDGHDGSFGSGRFCSRACANSRTKPDDVRQKVSASVKLAYDTDRLKPRVHVRSVEEYEQWKISITDTWNEKLLAADFDTLKPDAIRKRVLLEQSNKCDECDLDEWRGFPLSLELEHKDGDHHNNHRDNLHGLCPNCHSVTSTWRGRNKKRSDKQPVIHDEMVKAYLEAGNIRQALLKLNLAAKGANYGRVKKALTECGIKY